MVPRGWFGRLGSREDGGDRLGRQVRAAPALSQVPTEVGPYGLRLYEGLSVDDPYQIAVCAKIIPESDLVGYAVVVGDGTARIGIVSGMRIAGARIAGLCHGFDQFADQTSVTATIDDPELVAVLTGLQGRFGPIRHLDRSSQPLLDAAEHSFRRLREMSLDGQISADRICGHLRRLPAATIRPPADVQHDGLVPADPLLGRAFRLAWYTVRFAQYRRIGLERSLDWLRTAAVLDSTVEKMSHRLTRFVDDVDPGYGAAW